MICLGGGSARKLLPHSPRVYRFSAAHAALATRCHAADMASRR